eukprot:jgi/Mesvir1/20583/Mv14823-RA.3
MLPVALASGLRHKLVTKGCRVHLGGQASCVVVGSVPNASTRGVENPSVLRILPSTVLDLSRSAHGTAAANGTCDSTSISPEFPAGSPAVAADLATGSSKHGSAASSILSSHVGATGTGMTALQGRPEGRRVAGMRAGLAALREAVQWPIQYAEVAAVLGVQWPGGILLHGPSGVGKTLLVHAVAEECGAQLFTVNPGDVFGAFTGESEQRLREAFQKAQDATAKGPVVLFLDEVDAYATRRDGRRQHESRVVAQLLTLMDGVSSKERAAAQRPATSPGTAAAAGVVQGSLAQARSTRSAGRMLVVAATSRPNTLDPALRRPGRFDREVAISMPNAGEREEILALHSAAMPLAMGLDLGALAAACTGYTGADLASLCREASLIALRRRFSFEDAQLAAVTPSPGPLDGPAGGVCQENPAASGHGKHQGKEGEVNGITRGYSLGLGGPDERMNMSRDVCGTGPGQDSPLAASSGQRDGPSSTRAAPDGHAMDSTGASRGSSHQLADSGPGGGSQGTAVGLEASTEGTAEELKASGGRVGVLQADVLDGVYEGHVQGDVEGLYEDMVTSEDFQAAMEKLGPSLVRGMTTEVPRVTWDAIGGLDATKKRLAQVIEWPITHADAFQRLGLSPPRGVLLYGPPGCCKTTLAKAAANAAKTPLFTLSGADLFSMYVGEGERILRDTFRMARLAAPSILFFDEVDAVASRRGLTGGGGGASAGERLLSTLLTEMDGLEAAHGILVLAATNRPHAIDAALMRPGRLELVLYVPPPDETGREAILRIHTRQMSMAADVDLRALAHDTANFTGAELESLCREAGMMALRETLFNVTVEARHFRSAREAMSPALTPMALASFEHFAGEYHK